MKYFKNYCDIINFIWSLLIMKKIIYTLTLTVLSFQGLTSPWVGQWTSTFGKIQFIEKQTGYKDFDLVYGNYAKSGFLMGVSIDNMLHGVFFDSKSDKSGAFVFSLNKEKNAYEGAWHFDDIDKELKWNGTKAANQKFDELKGIDRYRNIEGSWTTNFGLLTLQQEQVFVEGSYDTKGKLYAVFNESNNLMFGFFTNKKKYGLLKFQLNEQRNSFKGHWSWKTDDWANQKWDGSKALKL